MINRKGLAAIAACAALGCAGLASGSQFAASEALSLSQPVYAQASAPRKPLMHVLDQAGLAGTLDEYGVTVGGHIEVGWSYNFDDPDSHFNPGRIFDLEDQDPTLHQIDLRIERAVAANGDEFDMGGKMEWMWGGDARFIHSNGLFDYDGFNDGPDEQFDLTQLYATFNVPVGNGLLVTAGKFVTLMGYETINPTNNPLYSHSYLFGFAIPFTHTGVLAKYAIDDNWSVTGGIVRGWEQSLEDNNNMVSFLGQVGYTSDSFDFYFTAITGPEQPDREEEYRTVFDAVLVYREGDNLTFVLNADYGWENDFGITDGDDGIWWGAAGYVLYDFNENFTGVGRLEFFSDDDGARGAGTELIEATFGVNIKPFPGDTYGSGLVIRPELRYDWSSDEVFNGSDNMFTFGIDAIYAF